MPSAEQAGYRKPLTALNAGNRSLADIEGEIVNGPHLPSSHWNAIAQTFDGGGSNDNDQAERLRNAATQSGSAKVRAYLTVFLTGDNDWRKASGQQGSRPARVRTGDGVRPRGGTTGAAGRALARRDDPRAHGRADHDRIRNSQAAIAAEKQGARVCFDYDDLIDKTLAMLNRTAVCWVHYKLDRGIDQEAID